jgi:hypothetical protein
VDLHADGLPAAIIVVDQETLPQHRARACILRPVAAGCFTSTGRSLDDAGAPEAG